MSTDTQALLKNLADTLGELHRFARDEQARDSKRKLLSPAADARIAALVAEGLKQAGMATPERPVIDQGALLDPWQRDEVQFPRLIAEINATQDQLDLLTLADSMDLSVEDVKTLFDRADQAWETVKAKLLVGNSDRTVKAAGKALEAAHPFGYRSSDSAP